MKLQLNISTRWMARLVILCSCLFLFRSNLLAQDSTAVTEEETVPAKAKIKPAKNTFQSVWIIDNQTVMVPIKGTMEMDIQHRFGVWNNGYKDFWGFFAPSNIRLGISYSPINKLFLGAGIAKSNMVWDASAKYSIITQTKGKYPVSVTYYGDAAYDTRQESFIYDNTAIKHWSDRMFFFNQIIIARKVTSKLSVQIAPSVSHQNAVSGFYTKNDSTGQEIYTSMKNNHYAFSFSARYKLTTVTSLMLNYDQPLTKHSEYNPNPNFSMGFEFNTSSHSFQLFFGNYDKLNPARNNLYNSNSPVKYTDKATGKEVKGGRFLIGFNVTRLWNY
jgi:hypothetical protein